MWDENMTEGPPLPLQEDLTCPVCREIFRDPLLLSCTHSFCRECLEKSWERNKTCPVCRTNCGGEQPIPNRNLNSACESFMNERAWLQPSKPLGEDHCHLHRKELQLYCLKDEEPVCVDCVTRHRTHELLPLAQAALVCKEDLTFKVKIFEKKLQVYQKIQNKFRNTVEFIKHQAGQAERQIKAEFERLHAVLVTEETARLKALADEEEEKISDMKDLIDRTSKDIATLTGLMENLKRDMGGEDFHLLKNFRDLKTKAQWTRDDPDHPPGALLNMGKHVGSLSFNIWKNMQPHIKFYPVVMDPNTASPWLSLNPELTTVKESPERQVAPDNSERFDPCVFVLGAQGFTSGKHRWDVNVADNPKWILGVCKDSVARKKKFTVSTDRGMWSIALSKGVYNAMTPKREVLTVQKRPETIRIKLNIEKGEVSFWDGGTGKHLCTFTHQFKEAVYPIFGPGLHSTPMVLIPAKMTVHTS